MKKILFVMLIAGSCMGMDKSDIQNISVEVNGITISSSHTDDVIWNSHMSDNTPSNPVDNTPSYTPISTPNLDNLNK